MERAPVQRLARTAVVGLVLMLILTVLAWTGDTGGLNERYPALTLTVFSLFLVADLVTIAAGITVAALRSSAAFALVPAAAIAMTFVMLLLGYDAWNAVR